MRAGQRCHGQSLDRGRVTGTVERGAVLHIDRAFTIVGRGTVLTGTLWSGRISDGDTLTLMPASASRKLPMTFTAFLGLRAGVQQHATREDVPAPASVSG
jgi:translation elongation factor EF-Tu-like GTPase